MKKTLISIIFVCVLTLIPVIKADARYVALQDSEVEQRLKEAGLDKKPGVVEVPKTELIGLEQTSGFVDENGNPMSQSEYDKYVKEQQKNIFEKYPFVILGVVALIIIVVINIIRKKNSRNNVFFTK